MHQQASQLLPRGETTQPSRAQPVLFRLARVAYSRRLRKDCSLSTSSAVGGEWVVTAHEHIQTHFMNMREDKPAGGVVCICVCRLQPMCVWACRLVCVCMCV